MGMRETLTFAFGVRCASVSIRSSGNPDRTEEIFTVVLQDTTRGESACVGRATFQDIPERVARELSAGLSQKRKYALRVELEELPDPQHELFHEGAAEEAADTAETRS